MSKAKHTPGPWASHHADGVVSAAVTAGNGTSRFVTVARHCSIDDARLIAAAPELLDACAFALTILEALGNGSGDAASACRAAIAKAEGQP